MESVENKEAKSGPQPVESTPDVNYFRALMSHFIHMDRTMWSRLQFLVAVQGAGIGVAYQLRLSNQVLALASIGLTIVLTVILLLMMGRAQQVRDENLKTLMAHAPPGFTVEPDPTKRSFCLRGRTLNLIVYLILLAIDVGVGIWILLMKVTRV